MARASRSQPKMPPVARGFASYQEAQDVIRALKAAGVRPRAISVITRLPADAETLEHDTGASEDLEDASHPNRLAEFVDWLGRVGSAAAPGLGAVLGTGDLWRDIQVAGRGHGAITGALVGVGVPVDEAADLERSVMDGRILVIVHGAYDAAAVHAILQPS